MAGGLGDASSGPPSTFVTVYNCPEPISQLPSTAVVAAAEARLVVTWRLIKSLVGAGAGKTAGQCADRRAPFAGRAANLLVQRTSAKVSLTSLLFCRSLGWLRTSLGLRVLRAACTQRANFLYIALHGHQFAPFQAQWHSVVVWCAEGTVTRRQWPRCLPTGTGKREGCVSQCALRASVLLYSRDQCTVALGRYCSANPCARSHRVYWAHCTVCAALHHQYFVCGGALLGAVHCTALCVPCRTALVGSGQWAVGLLECIATLPVGSGQCSSCNALPHCLGALGSGTPAIHCLTA